MKILFFSPRFYPLIGGVETHAMNVAKILVEKGHSVTIITENFGSNKRTEVVDGITVVRLKFGANSWFKKFKIWNEIWKVRSYIQTADIIHCHDVFFWYLPVRFLFPKRSVFTTFHGYETKFPPSKKSILIRKVSEKLSKGNICVGKYIEKWYGTRANAITYGGVGIPNKNQRLKKYKIQNTKYKILFLGRIENDNGVLSFARMIECLKEKNIQFDFCAVGDGSQRYVFEKFGKVYGFVQDTKTYIQDADIIFASSYLSMLDSLASGKLVVSVYDNALKKDYLLDSPFKDFVHIGDNAEIIVDKLLKVLKNKNNVQLRKKGVQWARQQTWEKVTDMYERLWESVILTSD